MDRRLQSPAVGATIPKLPMGDDAIERQADAFLKASEPLPVCPGTPICKYYELAELYLQKGIE